MNSSPTRGPSTPRCHFCFCLEQVTFGNIWETVWTCFEMTQDVRVVDHNLPNRTVPSFPCHLKLYRFNAELVFRISEDTNYNCDQCMYLGYVLALEVSERRLLASPVDLFFPQNSLQQMLHQHACLDNCVELGSMADLW